MTAEKSEVQRLRAIIARLQGSGSPIVYCGDKFEHDGDRLKIYVGRGQWWLEMSELIEHSGLSVLDFERVEIFDGMEFVRVSDTPFIELQKRADSLGVQPFEYDGGALTARWYGDNAVRGWYVYELELRLQLGFTRFLGSALSWYDLCPGQAKRAYVGRHRCGGLIKISALSKMLRSSYDPKRGKIAKAIISASKAWSSAVDVKASEPNGFESASAGMTYLSFVRRDGTTKMLDVKPIGEHYYLDGEQLREFLMYQASTWQNARGWKRAQTKQLIDDGVIRIMPDGACKIRADRIEEALPASSSVMERDQRLELVRQACDEHTAIVEAARAELKQPTRATVEEVIELRARVEALETILSGYLDGLRSLLCGGDNG